MSKKNNNLANFIAGLISVLLLVGAVGFVVTYTNGFNEDFKSFYLEYNDQKILSSNYSVSLEEGKEHKFLCNYLIEPEDNSFTVKVIANDKVDFNYTVAGEDMSFKGNEDLSSCFTIDIKDGYFTIFVPKNCTLENVLRSVHNNTDIVIVDDVSSYNFFYTLVVSNYNNQITYNIDFDTFVVS